jgi:hypothetical protein
MAFDRKDRVVAAAAAAISPAQPSQPSATRLCLRPSPPGGRGILDGGWWPRSRDPASELRMLVAGLNTHFGAHFGQLGTITRVALNLTAWDRPLSRVAIDDRIVPVGWSRSLDVHTVILTTAQGERVTLLVVPLEATAQQGAIALAMAALDDNRAQPAAILAASGITAADSTAGSRARHPSVSSARPSITPPADRGLTPVARLPRDPR